jgi:hypothetical protein
MLKNTVDIDALNAVKGSQHLQIETSTPFYVKAIFLTTRKFNSLFNPPRCARTW